MRDVVSQCISDNQIGFVPRCFIGEANHLLKMIQAHIDNIDEGGLLVFFDFEKAFDRVSWQYMKRSMRALRFSGRFMSWVDKLYDESNPSTRRMYVNGKLSSPFKIYTGTAQGCPLSPLLFLIVTEGLTRRIANNKDIKGIEIGDILYKISQYADDTTAILRGLSDLPGVDEELKLWCTATNMLENTAKREYLPLGNLRNQTHLHREWCQPGKFIISLGIPLGINFNVMDFLKDKYFAAKKSLAGAVTAGDSIVGKHRLLSAKYYGKFRYYLWHEIFPKELHTAIKQDAKRFLWRRRPRLDTSTLGGAAPLGKFIAKPAENRPTSQGGAGVSNWDAHVKAFQLSWIERLFAPRRAPWISIAQHWLKIPLGSLCFTIPPYHRRLLLRKVPKSATFFKTALENFLKFNPLKFDKSLTWVTHADQLKGLPLLFNPFLNRNPRMSLFETLLQGALHTVGAIFDDAKRDFYDQGSLKNIITIAIPRNKRKSVLKWLMLFISRLKAQTHFYSLLTTPLPGHEEMNIVAYDDDLGHPVKGRIVKSDTGVELQELEVDSSGFYTDVGSTYDLDPAATRNSPWSAADLNEIKDVTTWGNNNLILGTTALSFPLPKGWIIPSRKDSDGKPLQFERDKLNVSFLTSLLTPPTQPPNCEAKWEHELNEIIPWQDVWKNQKCPLVSTKDRKVNFKLLHRNLKLKGVDAGDRRCRACRRARESHRHFMSCNVCHPVRLEAIRYIKAMGINPDLIDPTHSWFTLLDVDLTPLPPLARTMIMITNRVIYRHLVGVDNDPKRPWDTMNAIRDVSKYLMSRILSFQQERRKFYLSWLYQKHRQQGTFLPKKMAQMYAGLGVLDLEEGILEINDEVKRLLKKAKAWKTFKAK